MNAKSEISSNKRLWFPVLAAVMTTVVFGCGAGTDGEDATGEVEGTVTMKGQSLEKCRVSFYNSDSGKSGGATINADGTFKFDDPISVGTYQVAILPPEASQPDDPSAMKEAQKLASMIPLGYQDGNNSGFTAEVKEGTNSFTFELKKSGPPRNAGNQTPP